MQSLTIRTEFEAFERDLKHSNATLNHSQGIRMQIQTIRKGFEALKCKMEPFERHSNANFEPFERDSKHFNAN